MTLLIDENIDKPIVDSFRDLELKITSKEVSPCLYYCGGFLF